MNYQARTLNVKVIVSMIQKHLLNSIKNKNNN